MSRRSAIWRGFGRSHLSYSHPDSCTSRPGRLHVIRSAIALSRSRSSARCCGSRAGRFTTPIICANRADGLKVGGHQASSASLAAIMTALYFAVLKPRGPRRGQTACQSRLPRHPISVRQADAREAGELPRLWRRAILSIAHKGYRRRRFLDRLGRPRRRDHVLRQHGAGLHPRPWLVRRPAEGAHDRARRRRRTRRRQYLRSVAGRLEVRAQEHLVDHRLQSPEPRRRGARGSAHALRKTFRRDGLGSRRAEVRQAAAGGIRRAWRRTPEAVDRLRAEPALLRA